MKEFPYAKPVIYGADDHQNEPSMHVLLISTYELGRQPVHIASPAAAVVAAGHDVRAIDLSVQPWDPSHVEWADVIGISTPMHTATRLAVDVVTQIRSHRPDIPIASYGLYAGMAADEAGAMPFDRAIVGEYEAALVEWIGAVASETRISVHLDRGGFHAPERSILPSLNKYAKLMVNGDALPVGAVEASHGCAHMCRHCPLPAVYDGRFRIVDADVVLADIDQLVASGARHITFGDPDFLNGPAHSLRIIRGMHRRHPDLTFDCTVKVEHILKHRDVWEEFAAAGCLFVVSAFESMNDVVLEMLDKGHTSSDAAEAVHIMRDAGIDIRPSWLPFTPWSTRADIDEMFRFISAHDLVASTDPVQMGIRLLIPRGSLVLAIDGIDEYLGPYDAMQLSYSWSSKEHELDDLAADLMAIAEDASESGAGVEETFLAQWLAVTEGTGLSAPPDAIPQGATEGRPMLTESWFCWAGPTAVQFGSLDDEELKAGGTFWCPATVSP
ncbi:MAG: CUAEP/CCAEP-tail radical SAM (seleno)protein, partial [Acidimicrobiia bacterium]